MNGELLAVFDHIEREKGIKREILIEACESALASAAKKVLGKKVDKDIKVKIDPETGGAKIFADGEEIDSMDFGRIAAQTAKQVIIQKIREAEKEVIYNEWVLKKNTIISGGVHKFEHGNIIVDLGKVEATLSKREQVKKEHYKQGDRIRAYVKDVNKTSRGAEIILSRIHQGLVKRLFELEVPEIFDGIVEIKSIAREPGERSKIAVFSKEEKVDAVGACVGMRGQRVKEIVRELTGEKIDIIRWNEDVREFVKASLSPAEISSVEVNPGKHKVLVIVPDDQLSLAIGKKGQNVRLACKLTKWDMDVRGVSEIEARKKVEAEKKKKEIDKIEKLKGVGPKTKNALVKAGFDSIKKILSANVKELMESEGIGKKTAEKILAVAKAA